MKAAIIDIDDPVFVRCADCDGRGFVGQSYMTSYCGCHLGETAFDMTDIACLTHNLMVAAALCYSFDLGSVFASRQMSSIPYRRDPWEPGCGWSK